MKSIEFTRNLLITLFDGIYTRNHLELLLESLYFMNLCVSLVPTQA